MTYGRSTPRPGPNPLIVSDLRLPKLITSRPLGFFSKPRQGILLKSLTAQMRVGHALRIHHHLFFLGGRGEFSFTNFTFLFHD